MVGRFPIGGIPLVTCICGHINRIVVGFYVYLLYLVQFSFERFVQFQRRGNRALGFIVARKSFEFIGLDSIGFAISAKRR